MQTKLTAKFDVLYDPSLNLSLLNLAVSCATTRSTKWLLQFMKYGMEDHGCMHVQSKSMISYAYLIHKNTTLSSNGTQFL